MPQTASSHLPGHLARFPQSARRLILATLLFLPAALMLAPRPAAAARKEALERAAKKACLVGDTAKGVEILAELYLNTNDIAYLFNQGRCLEQNRRYEDAISRFREYLVKGGDRLTSKDTALVHKHIEACESYLGNKKLSAQEPPPPTQPAPITPSSETTLPEPTAALPSSELPLVAATPEPPPSDDRKGSGLRIAGIAVGSLGAAALVSGVLLNLKNNSMARDLEKDENYSRSTDSTRKTYKTLGWVGYGVGAACLTGGALLYYLGWRSGHEARAGIALVPDLRSEGAGAMLTGAF